MRTALFILFTTCISWYGQGQIMVEEDHQICGSHVYQTSHFPASCGLTKKQFKDSIKSMDIPRGVNGTLRIHIILNCKSNLVNTGIVKSVDEELDQKVLEWIEGLELQPGAEKSFVVDSLMQFEISFKNGKPKKIYSNCFVEL